MWLKSLASEFGLKLYSDASFEHMAHCVERSIKSFFTFCDDTRFMSTITDNPNISCVITTEALAEQLKESVDGIVISDNPRHAFFDIHNALRPPKKNIETTVGDGSVISNTASVADQNVVIGKDCVIGDGVIIHEGVVIGDNTKIGAYSVLGGDGFQYWKTNDGVLRINHYGSVEIGSDVDTKEYCSIHKAVFEWDRTSVGNSTKIDGHVHIGHSNKIGNRVYLCSHANISGNTVIQDDCYIGPGANVPNRLIIASGAKVSIGASLSRSVESKQTVSGNFAVDHEKLIKHLKSISQ